MRILYMGSPEEAIWPLKTLLQEASSKGHQILGVISQEAKNAGRGCLRRDPPLAQYAKENGIPCWQPPRASDPSFIAQMRTLQSQVIITCAYGQILSQDFLNLAPYGVVNIHPSALPRWRGATPIPASLLAGESHTALSFLSTVSAMDAGPLLLQKSFPILPTERTPELSQRLFQEAGPLLLELLEKIQDPHFQGQEQDHSQATYCGKLKKSQGLVNPQWKFQVTALVIFLCREFLRNVALQLC